MFCNSVFRCSRLEKQGGIRRRLARPLHRIFRASPHSRGGASYAVTHSRRKYLPCMRFVARCCATAALRRWLCSLRPPGVRPPFAGDHPCVPAARLRAYRMYLTALFSCSQALSGPQGRVQIFTARFCRTGKSAVCFPVPNIRGIWILLIIRRNGQNILFICLILHFSHEMVTLI